MTVLLVTGSRTFCEATPGREHEDYMAERVALGFALDMIVPASIVAPGDVGAGRWARIWAERRGVDVTAGMADSAIVFPGGHTPTNIPIYQASIT